MPHPALLLALAALAAAPRAAAAQADTTFLEIGSPRVDASIFKPHAARVRIYDGRGVQTAEWDNELWVGDSAGRRVMRWSTVGRPVASNPGRPLARLLQTYDARTMQPLGYVSSSNMGGFLQLTIDGRRVRGVRRPDPRAALQEVDLELDVPGWMIGASDLVPVAAGLRTGEVLVAPLWGPNMTRSEYRVFHVMGDTTLAIEGMRVRARKVEERRRSDRSLTATWWLSTDEPYMYYGEVPLPDGGVQRMTEVPLPRAPGEQPPVDAVMFRGGAAHEGVYASAPPTLGAVAWKFRTQGRVLSSPAVHGATVFVGSTDQHLYAIDRATGTQRWRFATRGPITSSPAVAHGLVYISSVDGNVYAVDEATGAERWRFATKGERRFTAPGIHGAIPRTERMPDPFDVFLSSPTVVGNTLYIGSGDQHVYALDARTGAPRWSFATGDVVHASPAVVDGVVYIGSWDRNLYALDAESGRERWRYTTGNDTVIYNQIGIASSAAVAGGVVLVGGRDGKFHAVDAATGAPRWVHDNRGGWTIGSPAVRDGVVYFSTSDGRRFKAIDIATGAVRIDLENKAVSFSSPALAGDVAYYGTSDGWLRAVDLRTGAFRAHFQTDGSKQNGARWTDSTGVLQTGGMYPDRTLDGMMIGMRTMFTVGSILSSPVIADGVLYVGSADGTLYAIR